MPEDVGPVRSSRYYYIAWAAEWRAVYAHVGRLAAGHRDAARQGQRAARLQRRRVPLRRDASTGLPTRFAPHNLYTTGAKLRSLGKQVGAKDKAYKAVWRFAPGRAARSATVWRDDHGQATRRTRSRTRYDRKTNTYLPLGHRREEADRRGDRQARSRRRTSSSW